jgi:ketosteroid isomerase-like protein
VREVIEAWTGRDVDALLALTHPEAEYVNAPSAVELGTRFGHEGFETVVKKQWEGLGPDARQHIDKVHRVGEDLVTEGRTSRSMPGSSTRIENSVALRWSFREGLVVRLEVLGAGTRFKEALEAAGLRE